MSEETTTTAEAPESALATETPAASNVTANGTADTAAPPEAPETDALTMPDGTQLFNRDYVQGIRDQAADYRTKLRDAEGRLEPYAVFESYDPEDRAVWQEMARLWQGDPAAAATYMRAIATAVLGDSEAPAGTTTTSVNAEEEGAAGLDDALDLDDLTPSKVQKMIEDALTSRAEQEAVQRDVDAIFDQLRAADIDPHAFDGQVILWRAMNETSGDVEAAIKAQREYRQKIVDDYVASKSGAQAAPAGGALGIETPKIESLDDAFRAGREFLRQQRQGPGET